MNTTPRDTSTSRHTTDSHSSMSVSNKIVCEGEACIGIDAKPPAVPPSDAEQQEAKRTKKPLTSMSIGGTEACEDDACIGKK